MAVITATAMPARIHPSSGVRRGDSLKTVTSPARAVEGEDTDISDTRESN
jgi:hypothetical protein